jgi:hypothetical protein
MLSVSLCPKVILLSGFHGKKKVCKNTYFVETSKPKFKTEIYKLVLEIEGESHSLVVKADGSRSKCRGFESRHRILDGWKQC